MTFYRIAKFLACNFCRLLLRIRVEGTEHIPQAGGYILACNHRSNFDPILIAHRIKRQVHYLAKEELVGIPLIGGIIRALGIIPINRGSGDTGALDLAEQTIREGGVLGMFPEGHRSKDGVPLRPRSGVSVIAGKTHADILPCAVTYPKGVRFLAPVTVRYGPLIKAETLGIDVGAPSTIKAGTRMIMDTIISLMDGAEERP